MCDSDIAIVRINKAGNQEFLVTKDYLVQNKLCKWQTFYHVIKLCEKCLPNLLIINTDGCGGKHDTVDLMAYFLLPSSVR